MEKQFDLHNYDDIINMPPHRSPTRPHMSLVDRGAQFSPFAALTGYDAAVEEAGRLTDSRIELSDDAKEIIDFRLRRIADVIDQAPCVSVLYFVPDARKSGGEYVRIEGKVIKLDEYSRRIIFEGGRSIAIEAIRAIEGDIFSF